VSALNNSTEGNLAWLPRGASARIIKIDLPTEDELRVKTLGICVGRPVEMVQDGDPLIVRVAGTNVGLARRLADGILICSDGPPQMAK
jgi:Fe2+ transport system protein FeoA